MRTDIFARATVKHAKQCDCDDPDCQLPMGRCYLCGNPHDHMSGTYGVEFTVCERCAPKVWALHKREQREEKARGDKIGCGECPGWAPFDAVRDNGACCIQRCDECGERFGLSSDDDAAHYVAEKLGVKPTYPDGA